MPYLKMRKKQAGFTVIELFIALAMIAIMAAIAAPAASGWLPNLRLKQAASDLYSNLQHVKMGAVRNNAVWALVFNPGADQYFVCSDSGADGDWTTVGDNTTLKSIDLTRYGSGIRFGAGNAGTNATAGGGPLPGDNISYPLEVATFDAMGTGLQGFAYIQNVNNETYAVGSQGTGYVLLRRWFSNGVWD